MAEISAALQDTWPPRVLVTVQFLADESVAVYREVGGVRTPLRAGSAGPMSGVFLRTDAELPFGVPVRYVASLSGGLVEHRTDPVTYVLPGGRVAVSDAINGNAAEVTILAWDEKAVGRQASVFRVGGRNIAVVGPMGQFESTIELYVETTSSRDNLAATIASATEGIVQIRQPGGYDGVDSYLSVLGVRERRWSQDGSDQRRVFALDVAQTDAWAGKLEARGFTLADVAARYDVAGPNLLPNPTFEVDAAGWLPLGGTVARSTAQAHQGTASLLLTPNGTTATVEARIDPPVAVVAGKVYRLAAWQRVGSTRLTAVGVNFYNASNVIISSASQQTEPIDNTWTLNETEVTAPAGAVAARMVGGSLTGTPPASSLLYIDDAWFGKAYESLTALAADYATLLDLAQGDFS
ncbi:carbohydrate binding domain-containing protein [Micromonospora sp. NPDC050686]|uniref:carbohydrate binding domain-containing protein n=1 Tax=Micromonospora sp. NPDC050686 TaxID=3154631 RepID=UPI0034053B13